MTVYPMMSTMGVGRGIVFPNDSVWRLQPPDLKEMVELWSGNSGLTVPPPMMRTPYGMGTDGSVWEYAPTQPGGMIQLFNGQTLPVVSGISPTSGQAGTSVTITGTGFTGATTVKFGSTNATSFVVNSSTSITAVAPIITPGVVTITVTTVGGTSIGGASSQFTELMTPTNWNPLDVPTGVIAFSNSNLTITSTAGGGCAVRAVTGLTTGKHYFETTVSTWGATGTGPGVALSTATINTTGVAYLNRAGSVLVNGSTVASGVLGGRNSGDIIGIAVDINAQLIWFRVSPSGAWNAGGTANPATGVGGYSISAIAGNLYPFAWEQVSNEVITADFGATAFSGAVPAGFTAGWG